MYRVCAIIAKLTGIRIVIYNSYREFVILMPHSTVYTPHSLKRQTFIVIHTLLLSHDRLHDDFTKHTTRYDTTKI